VSEPKQNSDFPHLSREDIIDLTIGSARNPADVEFQLETAASITSGKALELRSHSGALIQRVKTRNANHGPQQFSVPAANLLGTHLILNKDKFLGVPTGMYDLENLTIYKGKSLQFLWQSDKDRKGRFLGFLRDLGNGIGVATDAIAYVVTGVVHPVGEVLGSILETIGNGLSGILNAITVGFLRGALRWLGTVVSALFDFFATLIKGFLNLVANVMAGFLRIVGGGIGGLLAWDRRLFLRGIGDFLSGIVGAVLAVLGKLVALIQAVLFMQLGERSLTASEKALLGSVYRKSVRLYNVRIVDGFAGLFSVNSRPFTLGNKIYMKGVNPATDPGTLVHECCHVWQNQHEGIRYIAGALWAQFTLPGQGYYWEDELKRGHFRWRDFNKEAQAQFLGEVFDSGQQIPPMGSPGEFYIDDPVGDNVVFMSSGIDYSGLARESVTYVRRI
jgi:hypothetical protein